MPNEGWSGDLNAAKEFHASVHRPQDDDRQGRSNARGGRGSSYMSRGGNNFANSPSFPNTGNSNNRRVGLLTELPSHFWNPINTTGTQNDQAAIVEDRGDPMNIDDRGMASSQWSSASRTTTDPAAAIQTGTGSVVTGASWGVANNSQPGNFPLAPVRISAPEPSRPADSVHARVVSPSQSLGIHPRAAVTDGSNGARDGFMAESRSGTRQQVTLGPRSTSVSSTHSFCSINRGCFTDYQLKDVQTSQNAAQGIQGPAQGKPAATQAGRQWSGLKASRHAGAVSPPIPTNHQQRGSLRRDLLQENGMLRGVQFTEDQGPQQDDDWLKTYNLNKIKDKCNSIAKQAFAAGDHEAQEALRKVATACNEVLRAKNELRDKKLEVEADKVLSKSQNAAWVHWIKFYRPDAPVNGTSSTRALSDDSNVQMQDAPMAITVQGQTPRASTGKQPQAPQPTTLPFGSVQAPAASPFASFGSPEARTRNPISFQQQATRTAGGFGSSSSQQLHKPAAPEAQITPRKPPCDAQTSGKTRSDGFDTTDILQPQPIQSPQDKQQSTKLTGLPSMFPQGLPPGFDDPQARQIFEDFFFQNKRLPQK